MLLDSPFREIHALRLADDGTIYAVAVNGPQGGENRATDAPTADEPARAPVPSVSTESPPITVVEGPVAASCRTPPQGALARSGRGAIYRIRPDGLWDAMWDSGEDAPYDLVIEPSGSLLVGTGTEGKIFRVSGDPARATLLARATARQVTALLREPSGRIVGAASNPGQAVRAVSRAGAPRHLRIGRARRRHGRELGRHSLARHQRRPARSPSSRAPATPRRQTRPGARGRRRTRMPEASKSSAPTRATCNGALSFRPMEPQPPVLTSVTTAYLPRNLRPEISSITVHPAGTVFQRPFSTGEMEIAGFEDNTSDGRPQSQPAAAGQAGRPDRRRRSAAASTRRVCRPSSGRRTTRTTIGCSST